MVVIVCVCVFGFFVLFCVLHPILSMYAVSFFCDILRTLTQTRPEAQRIVAPLIHEVVTADLSALEATTEHAIEIMRTPVELVFTRQNAFFLVSAKRLGIPMSICAALNTVCDVFLRHPETYFYHHETLEGFLYNKEVDAAVDRHGLITAFAYQCFEDFCQKYAFNQELLWEYDQLLCRTLLRLVPQLDTWLLPKTGSVWPLPVPEWVARKLSLGPPRPLRAFAFKRVLTMPLIAEKGSLFWTVYGAVTKRSVVEAKKQVYMGGVETSLETRTLWPLLQLHLRTIDTTPPLALTYLARILKLDEFEENLLESTLLPWFDSETYATWETTRHASLSSSSSNKLRSIASALVGCAAFAWTYAGTASLELLWTLYTDICAPERRPRLNTPSLLFPESLIRAVGVLSEEILYLRAGAQSESVAGRAWRQFEKLDTWERGGGWELVARKGSGSRWEGWMTQALPSVQTTKDRLFYGAGRLGVVATNQGLREALLRYIVECGNGRNWESGQGALTALHSMVRPQTGEHLDDGVQGLQTLIKILSLVPSEVSSLTLWRAIDTYCFMREKHWLLIGDIWTELPLIGPENHSEIYGAVAEGKLPLSVFFLMRTIHTPIERVPDETEAEVVGGREINFSVPPSALPPVLVSLLTPRHTDWHCCERPYSVEPLLYPSEMTGVWCPPYPLATDWTNPSTPHPFRAPDDTFTILLYKTLVFDTPVHRAVNYLTNPTI